MVGPPAESSFTRAYDSLRTRVNPELAEDHRDVIACGPLADTELQTDCTIVESLGDELENLLLARREVAEQPV